MTTKMIVTVLGARPQFIKAAAVSRSLKQHANVTEIIVHTGQHFDGNMSRVFFDELNVPKPLHNLGIGGGSHSQNTGRMVEAIDVVLQTTQPDLVLVYGDTDSTLAGALAAAKLCIPIAHVEAGLRSFNRQMPEEINRILTDHLANLLFAPSRLAVDNLAQEGIVGDGVLMVGDVMTDCVRMFTKMAEQCSTILTKLHLNPGQYVLATLHRKENTDNRIRLAAILEGLGRSPVPVILPLHPRTRRRLNEFGMEVPPPIRTVDPLGYLDTLVLEKHARLIATDSGGVQKEAYFHGVPCAILRDETEWVELVDLGANQLVGADPARIAESLTTAQFNNVPPGIYGDGSSAERIVTTLANAV